MRCFNLTDQVTELHLTAERWQLGVYLLAVYSCYPAILGRPKCFSYGNQPI